MRLVMMGTGTFAAPTFEALFQTSHQVVGLITQPDRAVGKERGSTRKAERGMKEIALERNIPVHQPESINTPDGIAILRELRPDLLVVAAYGQILSKDVLSVPTHGGINIHASLLPKYRGAAPIAWAIYHGETKTGVTIIRMSPFLDAGDILAQDAVDIGPQETAGELEVRLSSLGARLAVSVIDRLAAGPMQGERQDKALVTKAPKLAKEHGLIDWTRTAEQVCNQVRAMQPWPTAYAFLHQQSKEPERIIVCKAAPVSVDHAQAVGSVLGGADKLVVAAGNGTAVELIELQPAGKRRMTAKEFLHGHPLKAGDSFGSLPTA